MEDTMTMTVDLTERKRGSRCCADTEQQLSPADAQQITEDLQILAHPVRLQILAILARSAGQVCVCDLEAAVPVKQPTVSHHLRLLREAGLIDCERHGLWAYYFVRREALAALRARIAGQLELLA
jgi:ArsR family transcriptional regulator